MNTISTDVEKEIRQITNEMLSVGFQRLSEQAILSIVKRAYTAGAASRDAELREKVEGMKYPTITSDRNEVSFYVNQAVNQTLRAILKLLTPPTTEKTSNLENV